MARVDLVRLLRDFGIPVVDKRQGSDHSSGSFDPKFIVAHHTASGERSGDVPSLDIVRFGRGGQYPVPGPLSQIVLGRAGTVIVVTDGRANHPGKTDRDMVNRAVRGLPPISRPGSDDSGVDAAGKSYGIEAENNGLGEPWSAIQLERYLQICEALCRHFGWTENHVWGHKELTGRKIDPSFDMRWFRGELGARLAGNSNKDGFDMAELSDLEAIVAPVKAEVAALKGDLQAVKTEIGGWMQSERAWGGSSLYQLPGEKAVYELVRTPGAYGLVKVPSQAVLVELRGALDADPVIRQVTSDAAVKWFKSLKGYTGE